MVILPPKECMKPISIGRERQNQYVWPFVLRLTIRKLELCCHFIASTLFRDCQRCTHLEMQRNPNRMKETSCFLRCTKRKCTYFHFSILRVSLQRFSLFFTLTGKIRKDLSASLTKFISVWLLPEFSGHWLLADPVWWWFFVSRDDAFGHSHLATENERRTV